MNPWFYLLMLGWMVRGGLNWKVKKAWAVTALVGFLLTVPLLATALANDVLLLLSRSYVNGGTLISGIAAAALFAHVLFQERVPWGKSRRK